MNKKLVAFFLIFSLSGIIFSCSENEDTSPEETADGQGYKPNSNKSLELVDEADIDEDVFNLPSAFSLVGPPIITQEETSQCVAFSGAYYILSMYNGVKGSQNNNLAGSPQFAFAQYKKINKDNDCADGCFLFDDPDDGVKGMAEILKEYGTTSWNQTPFVNSNNCFVTSAAQVSQATKNKIDDYYRLDKSEFLNTEELKSWLYAGFPLWFAVKVDEGFQDLTTNIWNKASGKDEGGHAMVIVGYDDAKKAFKIANSWGEDWGDKGYGWVDYNYLIKLMKDDATEIGVLYPNDSQRAVFNKLSPASCGNAGWGDLLVNNLRNQEVAIEMSLGTTYKNDDAGNIDPKESENYSGLPKGSLKIKVYDAKKAALIKEYAVNITQCEQAELTIN